MASCPACPRVKVGPEDTVGLVYFMYKPVRPGKSALVKEVIDGVRDTEPRRSLECSLNIRCDDGETAGPCHEVVETQVHFCQQCAEQTTQLLLVQGGPFVAAPRSRENAACSPWEGSFAR